MPIALIVLGFGLVVAGVFFAIGGLGAAGASGSAIKGVTVQGPSWLIMVALGVGTILFGAWQFEDRTEPEAPPKTDPPVTVAFGEFEPFTYGDDPVFDDYWDSCFDGDWTDCDELYLQSPVDSDYEWFGATCGDTVEIGELLCQELFAE